MIATALAAKAAILEAFGGTGYPGDEHFAINSELYDPEVNELKDAFRGKPWTSVSAATVCRFKDALPLFTPEARHYYLPAYMIACIDAYVDADTAVQSVTSYLSPPAKPSGKNWDAFASRAALFSNAQKSAIGAFLEIMEQRDPGNERVLRARAFWTQAS
jgi:hypothetical protein